MKRFLGAAALVGGLGLSVLAQDPVDPPPFDDEAVVPAEDSSGLDSPAVEDPLNADAFQVPDQPADPAETLPAETLPAETLPAETLPAETLPAETLPAEPLPDSELESELNARQPDVVEPADPGAAAAPGSTLPRDLPGDGLNPPVIIDPVDPPREPIEDQRPLPDDSSFSEPLPPADTVPPAAPPAVRQPREFDPGYGAPVPPRRNQPQIEIGDVVRNPIRIYDARLLVLMGHADAATSALDTLGSRFPTDPRVPYLRFFVLSRTGQHDAALDALQQAISLERLYPMTDYNRFMEPLQGPGRFYIERVRRAASELASMDGLVEPNPDEVIPPAPEERPIPDSIPEEAADPVEPGA